jgi:hypothetical protein
VIASFSVMGIPWNLQKFEIILYLKEIFFPPGREIGG